MSTRAEPTREGFGGMIPAIRRRTEITMRAARLEDGDLHIRDIPVPDPGDSEALVKMSAAGVCHSDLHLARGDWFGIRGTGALGHEGIGIVEAVGPGADAFVAVGDRVILGLGGAG